jgi:glycerophosphoryl diester phosphodiesterase
MAIFVQDMEERPSGAGGVGRVTQHIPKRLSAVLGFAVTGILRVGHRGAAGHEPENTLAALERGIALGADYLEVDIQRTHDGHLVLMHDKFVDRTTDGTGRLTEMVGEEVRRLNAGNGQRVPLLKEALALADGHAGMILESITPGIGAEVFREVKDWGFKGPVIFSSFLHEEIRAIRELDAKAMTMALLEGVPVAQTAFAQEAGATHAGISLDSMTAEFGAALHRVGLKVFLYTVDTGWQIDLARKLDADGIISNFPERI